MGLTDLDDNGRMKRMERNVFPTWRLVVISDRAGAGK